MPRNGSGSYSRLYTSTGWADDRDAGTKITAARHDAHDQDLADALTASIAKDGQTTPTANLPMGGYRHTGVDDAAARDDYASAADVQDGRFNTGTTSGSSNAYTLTPTPAITAYAHGQIFTARASFTSDSSATLNVSGVGAKTIKTLNGSALVYNEIISGQIFSVMYDATADAMILLGHSTGWQAWTPTLGATGSMTITGSSLSHARACIIGGDLCVGTVVYTGVSTGGTPSTGITVTLPVRANNANSPGFGRAFNSSSKAAIVTITVGPPSYLTIVQHDSANWGTSNQGFNIGFAYEIG